MMGQCYSTIMSTILMLQIPTQSVTFLLRGVIECFDQQAVHITKHLDSRYQVIFSPSVASLSQTYVMSSNTHWTHMNGD